MWGCKLEFRGIKLPFRLCTVIFMHCDLLSALTTTTTPSAWQLAAETCPLRRLMLERKHRVSTKVTAMKSYWIELLFALKNGDFSAISVTERNYAPPILKVESHISDRSCATFWCNVDRYSHRNGNEWVVGARAAIHWNGSKYLVASEDCNRPFRLTQRCTQLNLPGLRLFVYCICIIMRHSHSNDREIPETKRFIPKGSELGITLSYPNWSVGHFRVPPDLCIKTRLSAQPLIWKWFFILMQVKLILSRKVVHLASFWKWGFLKLGGGLLSSPNPLGQHHGAMFDVCERLVLLHRWAFRVCSKAIQNSVNIAQRWPKRTKHADARLPTHVKSAWENMLLVTSPW